jgi:PadR family transcriptional regulator PadR
VLACLLMLRTPQYGYALLEQLSEAGIPVEGNTLYPLLRRLESQGLLISEWNTDESRPRKFYRTSLAGDSLAAVLLEDWNKLQTSIDSISRKENS